MTFPRMKTGFALLIASLAACGGAGDPMNPNATLASDGGTTPVDAAPATCAQPTAFELTPAALTVPAPRCGDKFDRTTHRDHLEWVLLDTTADARPDLVVTSDQCDATVGKTHWDLYVANADGFAPVPTAYAVPAARCGDAFKRIADRNQIDWTLRDVTADGRADLLVTWDQCDATVGKTHWDVYVASASGFASVPTWYAIPPSRCGDSFTRTADRNKVDWSLLDVSADGRPELVVTWDQCDATIGKTHWDVYAAEANGFASLPTPFALPASRCGDAFNRTAHRNKLDWSLLDLTADKIPDLVVTWDQCDVSVSKTHWDVYAASASGFASVPTAYALPAPRCGDAFDRTSDRNKLAWSLLSLGCGARASLVVTADQCDPTVGKDRWDVYAATEKGFAAQPASLALPTARCNNTFDSVADRDRIDWTLLDVTTDLRPDLVVTYDQCDTTVGATHWDVYRTQ